MTQLEQLENGEAAELAAALQPEEPVTADDLCDRLDNDLVRVGASARQQLLATKLKAGMPPKNMVFKTIHLLGVTTLVGELTGRGPGLAAVGPLCILMFLLFCTWQLRLQAVMHAHAASPCRPWPHQPGHQRHRSANRPLQARLFDHCRRQLHQPGQVCSRQQGGPVVRLSALYRGPGWRHGGGSPGRCQPSSPAQRGWARGAVSGRLAARCTCRCSRCSQRVPRLTSLTPIHPLHADPDQLRQLEEGAAEAAQLRHALAKQAPASALGSSTGGVGSALVAALLRRTLAQPRRSGNDQVPLQPDAEVTINHVLATHKLKGEQACWLMAVFLLVPVPACAAGPPTGAPIPPSIYPAPIPTPAFAGLPVVNLITGQTAVLNGRDRGGVLNVQGPGGVTFDATFRQFATRSDDSLWGATHSVAIDGCDYTMAELLTVANSRLLRSTGGCTGCLAAGCCSPGG